MLGIHPYTTTESKCPDTRYRCHCPLQLFLHFHSSWPALVQSRCLGRRPLHSCSTLATTLAKTLGAEWQRCYWISCPWRVRINKRDQWNWPEESLERASADCISRPRNRTAWWYSASIRADSECEWEVYLFHLQQEHKRCNKSSCLSWETFVLLLHLAEHPVLDILPEKAKERKFASHNRQPETAFRKI